MRRTRFTDPAGTIRIGNWTDAGIESAGRTYDPTDVDVLPPTEPSKVLGVGQNYHGNLDGDPPEEPFIWIKGGRNVVAGHGDTVDLPARDAVIYEAELGVVIGEQCRSVDPSSAEAVIAGYTCVNDLSDQTHADDSVMIRIKSFDNAAPMGPWLVPPSDVPDNPRVRLRLDGETHQDSRGDELVFSVAEAIAAFSRHLTLEAGDVIMMGTPGGFSPIAEDGTVEVEIEGIGTLRHDVVVP